MEATAGLVAGVSEDRVRKHIEALEGVRHPVAAPAALEEARRYIYETLAGLGYAMEQHLFVDNGAEFANVVATRAGAATPERRVLVVAHYDTVADSPGADDNASGVAGLLELATLFAGASFEKTVQFVAVNLEENADEQVSGTGLRGSVALAERARRENWDIDAVLVLESIAFASSEARQSVPPGLPLQVPEQGDFLAVVGNERSIGLVQEFHRAATRCRADLPLVTLVVPGNGEVFRDTRRSDHAPFWDRGYPALMLTDTTNFRNPHYHEPSDTLETLNLPFAAAVCASVAGALTVLAGASFKE